MLINHCRLTNRKSLPTQCRATITKRFPFIKVGMGIYSIPYASSRIGLSLNTMGSDPMVKKFFSHYAPRPLQQPQIPDMKQVKRSVCNHIRHFSLLSYLPSAGNPITQPPIRRLALPLIRSLTIIPPTTPHTPNSLFSAANTLRS